MKKILLFTSFYFLFFQILFSDTDIGGIINSNQTWTLANSPYNLTSDIQIAYGSTLSINPGVTILGNNFAIQTWGTLNAVGNEQDRITMYNTKILGGTGGVTSELFNIILRYCNINGGELYGTTGLAIYGSISIYDSVINGTTSYTYLWYPEKDCFIERNVFNNAGRISVGARDVNVYIRKNTFYTDKPITNTPYVAENWASYGTSETIIKYNTFLNTDRITIGLPSGYDDGKIDAKENYWSTTDEAIIQSMIYDKNDDLSCAGYIAYQPFLSSPHQEAPLLETEITISTPKYFILCNNYPNPFNPTTTITYGLEKDCNVLISIYDISGKLITMLQNEYKTQGTHSITWNGVDDFGNKVGGGVYFYQVKAGDFIETKKMVLLK